MKPLPPVWSQHSCCYLNTQGHYYIVSLPVRRMRVMAIEIFPALVSYVYRGEAEF